jgi:shikimate dehydrogenase
MNAASRHVLPRAAVIGWPVRHSLSPLIHATWAAREGVSASYEAIEAAPDDEAFASVIARLQREGYRGCNVTLPHKERALAVADEASAEARSAGAANMLTFSRGKIVADNSDIAGFAAAVRETASDAPAAALVLGAGGAARGVVIALKERLGARRIAIANRTRPRAAEIAGLVGAEVIDWSERNDRLSQFDLVVNATSLGMTGFAELDLKLDRIADRLLVADIVYAPLETALLQGAKARGLRTIDGLAMLMHQAVPAYKAWLGVRAEVDADLRARLEAALKARDSR